MVRDHRAVIQIASVEILAIKITVQAQAIVLIVPMVSNGETKNLKMGENLAMGDAQVMVNALGAMSVAEMMNATLSLAATEKTIKTVADATITRAIGATRNVIGALVSAITSGIPDQKITDMTEKLDLLEAAITTIAPTIETPTPIVALAQAHSVKMNEISIKIANTVSVSIAAMMSASLATNATQVHSNVPLAPACGTRTLKIIGNEIGNVRPESLLVTTGR